jgi:O-antigen ligase
VEAQFDGLARGSILPQTLQFRIEVWERDFFPLINSNFIDGFGPIVATQGLFPHSESMYVSLLLRGGIVLLLVFAAMILVSFWRMRVLSASSPDKYVAATAQAAGFFIACLVISMVIHPYLDDAGAAPMFFTSLGIISGAGWVARAQKL